jgi:hypothetical protein
MSGVEWMIVTVIGVCLIALFVILEVFFPIPDRSDGTITEENDIGNSKPVIHSASSHPLQ